MKEEHIIDALNLLDTDIIEETDTIRSNPGHKRKHTWKWVAAATALTAACLALVIYARNQHIPQEPAKTVKQEENLPMLTIAENTSDDMGFEGYMAYDISDLINNNPWSGAAQPATLPVYKNQLSVNEHFYLVGADFGKMRELLYEIASRFGLDANTLQITDDAPDEETRKEITAKMDGDVPDGYFDPTKLIAKAEGMEITVSQDMSARVIFEPAISLPEQYNFSYSASYKETEEVAGYLQKKYAGFIHMENPRINIYDGDYDTDLQRNYQISFFDAGKDTTEAIINYNFHKVEFCCDDDGKLFLVRTSQPDLSQKTGDYPIITEEEAKDFLLKGNYITTVPYELPGENYIARTELVYRTGSREQYFMPYYRFYVELPGEGHDYVELPEEERDAMKVYGVYYVPAVEEKYISNMPLWDGSFN